MRSADALRFAWTSLRGHPARAALVALATMVGVVGVVVLAWLGDAARNFVLGELRALGTNLVVVLPGRSETRGGAPPLLGETPRELTLDDALALRRIPGVRRVAPVVVGSAPASHGRLERETTILGSTPELFPIRGLRLARGRLWPADPHVAQPVCALGVTVARELFGHVSPLGRSVRLGDRRFRVVAVIASRGRSLGLDLDEIAVLPVAAAQELFDTEGLFRVLLEVRDRRSIPAVTAAVRRVVARRHNGEDDVTVITQDAVLAAFDRISSTVTWTASSIAAIALLVAGVLIMNVMVIAVARRRAEIGLLSALGATRATIFALFLIEALLLSLAGAAPGLALGEATTWVVARFVPQLEPGAPLGALATALGVALGTGGIFGLLPARRAAAQDPIQALRNR